MCLVSIIVLFRYTGWIFDTSRTTSQLAWLKCDYSWVIYRSSVTVESKGLFLTGCVIYKG